LAQKRGLTWGGGLNHKRAEARGVGPEATPFGHEVGEAKPMWGEKGGGAVDGRARQTTPTKVGGDGREEKKQRRKERSNAQAPEGNVQNYSWGDNGAISENSGRGVKFGEKQKSGHTPQPNHECQTGGGKKRGDKQKKKRGCKQVKSRGAKAKKKKTMIPEQTKEEVCGRSVRTGRRGTEQGLKTPAWNSNKERGENSGRYSINSKNLKGGIDQETGGKKRSLFRTRGKRKTWVGVGGGHFRNGPDLKEMKRRTTFEYVC